jgi:hypothetical protein
VTPTDRLLRFVREQPAASDPKAGMDHVVLLAGLERLRPAPAVHAIFETMLEKNTSFLLFDLEIYPAILARRPWRDGVLGEQEVCVAKNGAGDLYLFDAKTGAARLVDHDDDFSVEATFASFDDLLEEALWGCLENVQIEDLDDPSDSYVARVRLALAVAGDEPLARAVRARLVELGVLYYPPSAFT